MRDKVLSLTSPVNQEWERVIPALSYVMTVLLRKLRRAAALSPRDWIMLVEAWGEFVRVKVQLGVDAPAAIRRALAARDARPSVAPPIPPRLLEIFAIASGNHLFHPNCLPKAIVLKRMLDRRGIASSLLIGARKEDGKLLGHAWIEVGGVPVNESPDVAENFVPLSVSDTALVAWVNR